MAIVYTIGDERSFIEFIVALRRILVDHPDREDILDEHPNFLNLSYVGEHPVLPKQRAEQPARWIHIKLQAVKGEETTLIMREDNLYVCGFMNQQGDSFELIENPDRSTDILPVDEYNPQRLSWGVVYRYLLDADTEDDLLRRLGHTSIGHDFAMDAVHVLSHFPAWVHGLNPRMALAGLTAMVCDSARMDHISRSIARGWKNCNIGNTHFDNSVFNYGRISWELLMWKSKEYANPWPRISQFQDIYLVLNCRLDHPPQASSMDDHGRPRVELLAMRADLGVVGTTVMVFDGKRGHIIYREEEQEEKGRMVDLVLTGPCTSISAYGCFSIKIDIPPQGVAAGSSKGDGSGSIRWEWDCYNPEYTKEVDKGPMTRTIITPGLSPNVEVTYAVMSKALEATVQVKLRMKDGNSPCSVHGLITTRIGEFTQQSILFKRTQETAQHISPTADSPQVVLHQLVRSLELARNVVAVPCGQKLHIEVDLQIETSKNQGASKPRFNKIILSFHEDGSLSKRRRKLGDDGDEVEVNVAWYPGRRPQRKAHIAEQVEVDDTSGLHYPGLSGPSKIGKKRQRQPDISYVVRSNDGKGFSAFITELRRLVAEQRCCRGLMANHPELSSTRNHPVLPKGRGIDKKQNDIKPDRLFHVKLQVEVEMSSVTLVMRDDNLDIITFINQDGDYCSQLGDPGDREAPDQSNPKYRLAYKQSWVKGYASIMETRGQEQVENILGSAKLGQTFAADAVRMLSGYPSLKEADNPYLALVGLMVMVGDSARMEPARKSIEADWDNGTELTEQLKAYRRNWTVISAALLDWSDHAYQGWPQNEGLESIGITSSEAAREVVHLVFNDEDRIFRRTY